MPKQYPIPLGREMEGMPCLDCGEESMHYPGTFLVWDEPYVLPDEGEITFKFRTVKREENVKREKFSVDLEFVEIVSAKASKVPAADDDKRESEDAIDKLYAEETEKE